MSTNFVPILENSNSTKSTKMMAMNINETTVLLKLLLDLTVNEHILLYIYKYDTQMVSTQDYLETVEFMMLKFVIYVHVLVS